MIHQAARDMAVAQLGRAEWEALAASRALTAQHFIGVEYYSDADTLALLEMIAARLGVGRDRAFFELGRHWIGFVAASPYARMLRMAGDDLESFLDNLDRMHASIKSNMPRAQMPTFHVVQSRGGTIRVIYRSARSGLAPFVEGILSAVAERFREAVTITSTPTEDGIMFEIRRVAADA